MMQRLNETLKTANVAFRNSFEALEISGNPFVYFYDRRTVLVDVYYLLQ
jgi:hypothetical protein